ncbi:MAG: Tryptophanyl-tRNA synthetase [candidate division TM6 bacterium GW2011_GWF2_30_66]|nr:MAG: Tryptophanyl-tRNA synthetase [candidate division TM6 bacterium GW2011_GWF2_30_66]
MAKKDIVLTGDRPTGPLHLGHFVGSLQKRVELQDKYKQFVMIADWQGFTDNFDNPQKLRDNVTQVMLDYLAVGIDPKKTTFFIQSLIPQIAELYFIYLNFVTVSRLGRNPTVKAEIQQKGYGENLTAGFLTYPVHQAADITIVKGTLVPAGADQNPIIEQSNEIVRKFNSTYNVDIFPEIKIVESAVSRLPGTDGKAKMSKSMGNAIFLCDTEDVVAKKVMTMYTDPDHIKVDMPGKIDGNTVFAYLDVFDTDKQMVESLKAQYQAGGLGDVKVKKYLIEVLNNFLEPIRLRRNEFAQDKEAVLDIVIKGSEQVRCIAADTMLEVRKAIHLDYI